MPLNKILNKYLRMENILIKYIRKGSTKFALKIWIIYICYFLKKRD